MSYLIIGVTIAVAVQSLLFFFYLLKNGNQSRNSKILMVLIFVLGTHFLNLTAGRLVYNYEGYVLSWIALSSYGPIVFIYVRSFLNKFDKQLYFNFLVPLYPLVLWLFTDKLHHESSHDTYLDVWASLPVYGSLILYLLISAFQIQKTPGSIQNIKWLKYLVVSFCLVTIVHVIVLVIFSLGNQMIGQILLLSETIYMAIFASGMIYTALSKPILFVDVQKIKELIPGPPKYFYTGLESDEIDRLLEKLENFMRLERPYLDAEITLQELAEKTEISKRYISQIINERLNCNFKEYLNTYRINEAIELLNDATSDHRIFEVMYKVGFNSKSSFNISFKRVTGQTPTEYRKNVLTSLQPQNSYCRLT